MGRNKEIVMDGRRDISDFFPDAELKIFMTAKAQVPN
jgi:cytidylate kinase